METTKTIPQALAVPAFAAKPALAQMTAGTDTPPWIEDDIAPPAIAARRQARRAVPDGRMEFEAVHWSVVALTLFTAASVLLGAFGGEARPKELLPIVITVAS